MILEPPPQYVHAYTGPLAVFELPAIEVERRCADLGKAHAQACSWPPIAPGGQCSVWLPIVGRGGVGKRTQDALRRHEISHCAGWVHQ